MKKLLIMGILLGAFPLGLGADGSNSAAVASRPVLAASGHAHKKSKARTVFLSVTEDGFVPADIKIKKGQVVHLVVTRKTDQTCATQISVPGHGTKDLPLDVPVTITLIPKVAGDIHYSCGMGMLHGVLSVE